MTEQLTRRPAVAGSWYPGDAAGLRRAVAGYLDAAGEAPAGDIAAIIAPHAGLVYSGPVGAYAYRAVQDRRYEVAVLVGPSHFVGFDGVAVHPGAAFDTPLGPIPISRPDVLRLLDCSSVVRPDTAPHVREHSLEMQLPFLHEVLRDVAIVPLVMGFQARETILALADALASTFADRNVLLVASTDLSHYFDGPTANRLDAETIGFVRGLDDEGLLRHVEQYPESERGRFVACGAGPAIAVLRAARHLGARHARILRYADSGDVSGDKDAVVGYLAAAVGCFDLPDRGSAPDPGSVARGDPYRAPCAAAAHGTRLRPAPLPRRRAVRA